MSKQAYYKFRKHQAKQNRKEEEIIRKVLRVRQEQPRLGRCKLHYILKSKLSAGRDQFFEILRKKQM